MSTTRPAPREIARARRSLLLGAALIGMGGASALSGCSHDWDAFDPRLGDGGTGGATGGAGGATTSTGGTTTTGTGGATTSTGGAGGTGGTTSSTGGGGAGGEAGGTTTSSGGGGTGGMGGATSSSSSSSSGGGGSGGGGPTECGGTSVLADDFTGPDATHTWYSDLWGAATIAQVGGEVVVTLPDGSPAGSGASFGTRRYHDLRQDAVSVEVTAVPSPLTTAQASFTAGIDGNNYVEIHEHEGDLHIVAYVAGVYTSLKSMIYDPVAQRHWQLRDDGLAVHFETSPDGVLWTNQTEIETAMLFPLDLVRVWVGAGTDGGEVSPGEARFDRLNGGGAPAEKWCPASSFTDDFDDGAQDLRWARSWSDVPGLLAEANGELVLALVPNATEYAVHRSAAAFDLTGSSLVLEVPVAPGPTSQSEAGFVLSRPGDDYVEMLLNEGQLQLGFAVADTYVEVASLLYSPVQHRWWRVREASGTLYWETAPDGKTWTIRAEYAPLPFPMDALDVEIGGGTWSSQPTPGEAHFDNLNLPPP